MQTLFDDAMRLEDGKPVPMPVQLDLIDRGRACYRDGVRRVLFQAPCGGGKTICASVQTQRALALRKTTLHVAPRRKLVDQMLATLEKFDIKAAPVMEGRPTWASGVYCASRDTLLAMLKAGRGLPAADFVCFDEAHVAAAEVQRYYLERHPNAFWTGYTATPVQPDGSSLAPPWQALVSMAPTSKMIELGRLVPVKVFNPDAVGRRRRKGDRVKPVGDPVDHWKKYADGLPTVAYAATVADSLALCRRYNEAGIPAEHLDADTPEDEREEIFERSRLGMTKVVCNVAVLIYGVDLPWLHCCQILRGCNSLVLWFQSVGRVMRASEGKLFGVVLDHAGAAHEYGMPDADFTWTLEDGAANVRRNKKSGDARPVTCLGCGLVFSGGPACPECGRVLPKKKRKSLMDGLRPGDGILTEFVGDQADAILRDRLTRLWHRCVGIARGRGLEMRAAAGMFSRETKMAPWEADLPVELPYGKEWSTPAKEWCGERKVGA